MGEGWREAEGNDSGERKWERGGERLRGMTADIENGGKDEEKPRSVTVETEHGKEVRERERLWEGGGGEEAGCYWVA